MPNEVLSDDLDPAIQAELEAKRARFKATVSSAVTVNPDDQAKYNRIATFLDQPKGVVAAMPQDAERSAAIKTVADNAATSPVLQKKYTDADFAKLAHDDSGVLASIAAAAKYLVSAPDAERGLIGDMGNAAKVVGMGATVGLGGAIFDTAGFAADLAGGLSGSSQLQNVGATYRNMANRAQESMNYFSPEATTSTGKGVVSGLQSAGTNLALLPLGLGRALFMGAKVGGSAIAGAMGLSTGAQAYNDARNKGKTEAQALAYGVPHGVFEYVFEKIPAAKLFEDMAAGKSLVKTMAGQAAPEVWTEQLTTVAQDFNTWMNLNPDKTLKEFAAERPDAAYQTLVATLVGVGLQSGAARGIDRVMGTNTQREAQAKQAEQHAQVLEAMQATMQASKLLERSPDTLRSYAQDLADEGVPTVYVDSAKLVEAGVDPQALAQAVPSVAAQLAQADTGGDLAIPTGELLANTIGTEFAQPLIDHARTDVNGMSRDEAKLYMAEKGDSINAEIERVMAAKENDTEFKAGRDQVQAQILTQLNDIKRFTSKVNEQYATLAANFYAVMAARTGMTVQQFADTYKLGFNANEVAGGMYDQGGVTVGQKDSSDFLAAKSDAGLVGGHIKDGALRISSSEVQENMRGKGEGIKLYAALIDKALADGVKVFSDSTVEADAVHVYEALKRRGYDVRRLEGGQLDGGAVYGEGAAEPAFEIVSGPTSRDLNILNQAQIDDPKTGVAAVLLTLGQNDDLYQYPRSNALELTDIASDKSLLVKGDKPVTITVSDVDKSTDDTKLWVLANTTPNDDAAAGTKSWILKLSTGKYASMTRKGGEAYVNVSGVGEGNGGSLVYDVAANYALNNGLVFVGDPNGVSAAAMRRRLENMLSSAIKYGTTDHLKPHPDQYLGDESIGVPPLDWTDGDTLGNIRAMVDVSIAATGHSNPIGADLVYDATTATFRDASTGDTFGNEELTRAVTRDRGLPGTGKAGVTTLQRNALFKSLVQSEGARRAFLESVRGQQDRGSANPSGALAGTFYQGDSLKSQARGQIAFGNDITQETSIISLLKNADLSTFIHESGHFFLEVQTDLANRIAARIAQGEQVSEGERSILDDMNKTLGWLGVKPTPEMTALDHWSYLSTDEKRGYHEQWARGFEAYAFEGKAPSLDLQHTFQAFRAWLVNVYRALLKSVNGSKTDIEGAMKVELSDEVRSVMDRMLATSDQIAEAEAARDMGPLFKTAEEAGMTLDEFKAYHDQGTQATMDAVEELQARGLRDMQWLQNARSRKLKELQKRHDALRAQVTREVRREVMAQPIYRAWTFLTSKRYDKVAADAPLNLPELPEVGYGRLQTEELRRRYGTKDDAVWRKLSELRMTSDEGGLNPDVVGELFGFSSGDELVKTLAETEPPKSVIEGMVDTRMLQEHGDLATPAGLERAADAAIHNDARAKFVATELKALQKAMSVREKVPGQKNTVDVLARAARDYATAIIAKLKVRDIRPGQYAAAEVRSAKAAAKAVGDIAQATMHKRNQLINLYATKAAYAAQEDVKSAVEYFKKFDKVSKTLDPEYADQIHALLERFDLRTSTSLKTIDKRKSLVEWVQDQADQGMEPDIPPELLQEANRKSFKEMTVEEVRGLRDTIKQIEHLGRLKNRLLTAQANRDFGAAVDEITTSINLEAGTRKADTRTPNTVLGAKLVGLKNFWAEHIKAATWARVMDGGKDGGPVWEYLIRTANMAGDNEVVMREKATKELAKLVAPVLKEGKMGGKGEFFKSINRSLNKEAKLAIALNLGNESNTQRLLGGEGWSIQQLQPVLNSLSPADWQFVQAVWDHFESYRPAIGEKEKRVYGKEPNWVEPTPVQTPYGTLRGGYYPIKYDPRASERAESHEDAEAAKRQLAGAYTSATTRRSFTKSRVEEVNGRPLLYSLDGIYNGVQEVIHDLTWHEWLIDANKLVRNKRIAEAMRSKYGPDAHQQFKRWLEDNAEGDRGAQGAGEKALAYIRQGVSVSGLGWNVMSALMQPLGITQSMARIGPKWVGKGVAKFIGSPLETADAINEKSDFMRTRALTRLREINEVRSQVKGRTKVREAVDASAYFLMMRCQQAVDIPTWWGAYEKAIAEGNDESRSVALSDQAVIDAQGSGGVKDQSAIERGGPGLKLFTTFYSFFNTALNLGVQKTMNHESKAKLAADYLLLYSIPVILGAALKEALTPGDSGDWDDPEHIIKKLIGEHLSFLFGLLVGVREVTGAVQAATGTAQFGADYSGPAGVRMLADLAKLGKQSHQGELDPGLRKAVINTSGQLLRLPAAQVNRTVNGIEALRDGKTQNPGALLTGHQDPK
jgi:GNAT superfamily N-acetyltransferase